MAANSNAFGGDMFLQYLGNPSEAGSVIGGKSGKSDESGKQTPSILKGPKSLEISLKDTKSIIGEGALNSASNEGEEVIKPPMDFEPN